MSGTEVLVGNCRLLGRRILRGAVQRAILVSLVLSLCATTLLGIVPAHAQRHATPAFRVVLTDSFFGAQALSVKADDLSHPDRARFTITNSSELWYSVRVFASPDALKPVAANPGDDLVSQAMVESGLLMPSDIIPLNPDLSLYQSVTLQSHFTAPGQQVSLEFNPFTFDAAAFDCVRLALLLVGQGDIGQEVGLVVPGAIEEIIQEFNHAKDLVNLVNDFVKLLNAVAHGQSPLGPANAVFDDLLHVAGDVSELGALAAALGIALGRHINLNPLKIVLSILNGAKYLTDLIRSFGAYLFANGNYPTITLRSVAPSAPAPVPSAPTGPGKFVVYPIADGYPGLITAGPDGNLWFAVRSGGSYHIDRITLDGHVTKFPLPAIGFDPQLDESQLSDLAAGPDGALWFTVTPILAQSQPPPGHIGRITTAGKVTLFPLAATYPPTSLTTGPDGNIWFTQEGAIGRITPEGKITEFPVDLVLSGDITVGADGNIWFAALDNPVGQIGRVTRAGKVTLFPLPPGAGGDGCFELCPVTFVSAPDGALWLADVLDGSIVRVTTSGHIATFPVNRSLGAIAVGPDGSIWFSSNDGVARMTLAGSVSHPMPGLQAYGIGTMAAGPDGDLWMAGATTSGKGVIVRAVP